MELKESDYNIYRKSERSFPYEQDVPIEPFRLVHHERKESMKFKKSLRLLISVSMMFLWTIPAHALEPTNGRQSDEQECQDHLFA